MSIRKIYNVIGIMSGTSMDGLDCSYVKTNGCDYIKILSEKSYKYSDKYRIKLKEIVKLYSTNEKKINFLQNDDFVTKKLIEIIIQFIKEYKIRKSSIDYIGLSGQTVFHDPKNKITIQLGSCRELQKKLNIKVIGKFRENDIKNGGQGAPIGAYYHKYIINKFSKKSAILNIGGISNITFIQDNELIAYDIGPGNSLIDDLTYNFYNKNFDNKGHYAFKGKCNKKIIEKFTKDPFFKLNYPKSLDREYFKKYYKSLKKLEKNDSICTATKMTIEAILLGIELSNLKFENLILTGGGRKNLYIIKYLEKSLKKNKIKLIK
ncbi:MAG: Anhydro-N-acetylmuramic acid kinase, partial [Alphaproteobacteria bacterium MarineAlpha5_Bin6]